MAMATWEFDDGIYCALTTYDGFGEDQVIYHELSEARVIPASAASSDTATAAPGPTAVTVKIYSPEEGKPPSVYFDSHQTIPFAVLKHFIDGVTAAIDG